MRAAAFWAAAIALIAVPAHAETVAWICKFPTFNEPVTFVWEVGKPNATMIGNAGTAQVVVHGTQRVISFIEYVGSGAVMTSTIVLATGAAVHSRNTVMGGDLVVSQGKGVCQRRD